MTATLKKQGPLVLPPTRLPVNPVAGNDANGSPITLLENYDWTGRLMRSRDWPSRLDANMRSRLPIAYLPENVAFDFSPETHDSNGNMWLWQDSKENVTRVPRCVLVMGGLSTSYDPVGIGDAVLSLKPKLLAGVINVMGTRTNVDDFGPIVVPLPCYSTELIFDGSDSALSPIQDATGWVGGEVLCLRCVDRSVYPQAVYVIGGTPATIRNNLIAADQPRVPPCAKCFTRYQHRIVVYNSGGLTTDEAIAVGVACNRAASGVVGVDIAVTDIGNGPNPGVIAGLISAFFSL